MYIFVDFLFLRCFVIADDTASTKNMQLFYLKISNVLTSFDNITTSDILVDTERMERYTFYSGIKQKDNFDEVNVILMDALDFKTIVL